MEIEIINRTIRFEEVPIGSLFAYPAYSNSDRDVYMAVEEHSVNGDRVNAVNLSDGYLHDYHEDTEVRLLNSAKLVIG